MDFLFCYGKSPIKHFIIVYLDHVLFCIPLFSTWFNLELKVSL